VFLGGAREKVDRIRTVLPDAVFATWTTVAEVLREAIANPPRDPVVPESRMAGYAGVPLASKLGIQAGLVVGLIGAPGGFVESLQLPCDVRLQVEPDGSPLPVGCDLTIWFVHTPDELNAGMDAMSQALGDGRLWIAWRKASAMRAAGIPGSAAITQQAVRGTAMAAGLVDFKICAIDQTWSALLFKRRRSG
jgi:hypothetical protein